MFTPSCDDSVTYVESEATTFGQMSVGVVRLLEDVCSRVPGRLVPGTCFMFVYKRPLAVCHGDNSHHMRIASTSYCVTDQFLSSD